MSVLASSEATVTSTPFTQMLAKPVTVPTMPVPPMPPGSGAGGGDAGDAGVAPSLGANVIPAGVVFRVWAPHATAAQVAGDFPEQSVVMSAGPGGVFSATVAGAHAGTTYRFILDGPTGAVSRLDY